MLKKFSGTKLAQSLLTASCMSALTGCTLGYKDEKLYFSKAGVGIFFELAIPSNQALIATNIHDGKTVVGDAIRQALSASLLKALSNAAPGKIVFVQFKDLVASIVAGKEPATGTVFTSEQAPASAEAPTKTSPNKIPPSNFIKKPPTGWSTPPAELMAQAPCHLDAAPNTLYHPVNGSDSNSVYFLLGRVKRASNKVVSLAARFKNGSLSVRVSGAGLAEVTSDLTAIGLQSQGTYASVHYSAIQKNMAQRIVYAVLGTLNGEWELAPPKVEFIMDKGV